MSRKFWDGETMENMGGFEHCWYGNTDRKLFFGFPYLSFVIKIFNCNKFRNLYNYRNLGNLDGFLKVGDGTWNTVMNWKSKGINEKCELEWK